MPSSDCRGNHRTLGSVRKHVEKTHTGHTPEKNHEWLRELMKDTTCPLLGCDFSEGKTSKRCPYTCLRDLVGNGNLGMNINILPT